MNKKNTILLLAAIASLLTGFFLSRSVTIPEPEPVTITIPDSPDADVGMAGKHRPDFSLADVEGRIRHINEWDGQVLVVNFWASWCSPCLQEIPELVDLQTRFGPQGLQVIGIALQKPEELGDFIRDFKMNYPVLAGEEPVIEIAESYGNLIGALPYTAIIDRSGKIVFVRAGPVTGAEVEMIISTLL